MFRNFIVAPLAAVLLTACVSAPVPDRHQQAGTAIGAVVGGVVGNQIGHGDGRAAATILGAIAGGFVGNQVGRYMDETDRLRAAQVLETTPTGARTSWRNPDTGREYTVVPTRTYASAQGPCRECSGPAYRTLYLGQDAARFLDKTAEFDQLAGAVQAACRGSAPGTLRCA